MPRVPRLQRLPPYALTIPAWAAATGYTFLTWHANTWITINLPPAPGLPNGYHYAAQVTTPREVYLILAAAAAATLTGSALLRRAPLWALGLLLAGSGAATLMVRSVLSFMYFLPVDIALYLIAAHRSRRTSTAAAAMTIGSLTCYVVLRLMPGASGWLGAGLSDPPGSYFSTEFVVMLPCVIFWLAGSSSRQAREYAESIAAQTATAERLRISRELHDSVAHNIGIIAVLAGAAGRVIQTQPIAAREALSSIETTSRDTLTGLQRMLRALRYAETDGPGPVPLDPPPGLRDLERLTAVACGAGVRVEVTWRGERRALSPEIELSAFRIIQEAVTNVVRHSGAPTCRVSVEFEPDGLAIEIVDGGPGPGHDVRVAGTRLKGVLGGESGFGLLGMRERVSMLSGQFSAGPLPAGGFRVAARLPA